MVILEVSLGTNDSMEAPSTKKILTRKLGGEMARSHI